MQKPPPTLLFKRCLYTLNFTQWKIQSHAGAAVLTLSVYPFCIQKVSGDLHIFWPGGLLTLFWLSFLMNVNLVSPEVFFFNLHLLKALKLYLYRTKVQWVITKKVLNSKI